jgi:hypothetical protein
MQRGFMTTKWQSTITKKKLKDESFVIYHKSTSDKDALAMMCERDEEPRPIAYWKIAMACAHYMTMDTCCWY